MSKERKGPVDEPKEVPAWIVSFSDMVTLLLAFFVLLQTFASQRDPELFNAGQGSFKRAVSGLGLSAWRSGQMTPPVKDFHRLKYPTAENGKPDSRDRVIDANDDQIRATFRELKRVMEAKSQDVKEDSLAVFATPITFAPSSADLSSEAKRYLRQFAQDMRDTVDRPAKLYVIARAADVGGSRGRWMVSARRAEAVREFLARTMASGGARCDVYSWGAGASMAGPSRGARTQVAIAVARSSG